MLKIKIFNMIKIWDKYIDIHKNKKLLQIKNTGLVKITDRTRFWSGNVHTWSAYNRTMNRLCTCTDQTGPVRNLYKTQIFKKMFFCNIKNTNSKKFYF